ncbi:5-bromo-4-chloroindolyl phosphate hydrolysis protein [Enterococcus sp. PF1-24]|uniref:5-bromo-4-chloroindolyl phosphate hydrolysis family protein n=1 Tax=unclassified Enterococcus TaxID=2608891 RepID=UPI002474B74D|nr:MULTISPECIES: 5-bromo-4-chloroindolyl phosphate hydrolysis family protein [unclassified Enterococcus]MDH6365074.1 5-bromo-4-chloroindolyl phosphate hydrolysis protein [Enterococcus sp. PFB1-1]MDH6402153.1 5-bromo-4-chloroindolyl phosphate hydrolysis protein [Enterococcus sp. PF1-24]
MKKFGVLIVACLAVLGLITADSGSTFSDMLITLAFFGGGLLIIMSIIERFANKKKRNNLNIPELTKEKEDFYEKLGMKPNEIDLFRDTMNSSKSQIERIQKNVARSSKLKAIDLRHDTMRAAKALFKALAKEPTRLHDASHFLYTHLPNLADLTDKYVEIDAHEVKSKETYAKLDESIKIIDQLAILIVKDYQDFVSEDLEDLDVEMTIAKQSIKRDHDYNNLK